MRFLLLVILLIPVPIFAQTSSPTELPSDIEPITGANIHRLERLGRYGRGWYGEPYWTPDSETLIVDGSIGAWLYNSANLTIPPTLLEDNYFLTVSPDGKVLTQDADLTLRVWTLDGLAASEQAAYSQPREIEQIAFLNDGAMLAAGANDTNVYVWNVETGEEIRTFRVFDSALSVRHHIAFSPDHSQVGVVWSADDCAAFEVGSAAVFDLTTGETVFDTEGYQHYNDIAFSPDGRQFALATAYANARLTQWGAEIPEQPGALRLYETQTGEEAAVLGEGNQHFVGVEFSPNGSVLAGWDEFMLTLWDMETNQSITSVPAAGVVFSPDSTSFMSVGTESANLMSLQPDQFGNPALGVIHHPEQDKRWFSFNPDGRWIAEVGFSGHLAIYDGLSAAVTRRLQISSAPVVILSLDGETIQFQNYERESFVIDYNGMDWYSGEMGFTVPLQAHLADGERLMTYGSGGRFAATHHDNQIRIWDLVNGELLHTLPDGTMDAAFSPNGSLFLYQSSTEGIQLIASDTGELLAVLPGGDVYGTLEDAAFNAEGSRLVYVTEHPQMCVEVLTTMHIWDAETGEGLTNIETFDSVGNVELSDDGSLLLAQLHRDVLFYDAITGEMLLTLPGTASAFSTDGRMLFVRGRDGRAELWAVRAG